jgi:predicted O-methyltransferase YrrM
MGITVLPKHYYVPYPDIRDLERKRSRWAVKSQLPGIHVDLDEQAETMRAIVKPYFEEYRENTVYTRAVQGEFGPGFGRVEAMALHGFIRWAKPKRIVEVGSGMSTYCMVSALEKNAAEGRPGKVTCVEPYPSKWVQQADVSLIAKQMQEVDVSVFEELEPDDILFIDSSHTVRVDGDVNRVILEVLPRLKPGVIVHFHDIYLPYDYNRQVLRSFNHWMETAMLHAFLIGNVHYQIMFCMSLLHYERPGALRECFPDYRPKPDETGLNTEDISGDFPCSIYMRVV